VWSKYHVGTERMNEVIIKRIYTMIMWDLSMGYKAGLYANQEE
jgi:hypothetical protein